MRRGGDGDADGRQPATPLLRHPIGRASSGPFHPTRQPSQRAIMKYPRNGCDIDQWQRSYPVIELGLGGGESVISHLSLPSWGWLGAGCWSFAAQEAILGGAHPDQSLSPSPFHPHRQRGEESRPAKQSRFRHTVCSDAPLTSCMACHRGTIP